MCLGWFQEQLNGINMLGHDGADLGVSAEMWFHSNGLNSFGVMLMMNTEPSYAIVSEILGLLIDKGRSSSTGQNVAEQWQVRNFSRSRRLLATRSRLHQDI